MVSKTVPYPSLAGSPAQFLAIEGMYEAAKAGHLIGFSVAPDNEAVVGYENDVAVAMVAFVEYHECHEFWIQFGYCDPQYRRKGHYRACIEALRKIARERGYSEIHTATHPDNTAAKASILARGGKLGYVEFTFPVEP